MGLEITIKEELDILMLIEWLELLEKRTEIEKELDLYEFIEWLVMMEWKVKDVKTRKSLSILRKELEEGFFLKNSKKKYI